jgi:hypothetical protein
MLSVGNDQFHVARGDTCVGRFAVTEILSRVERGELDPFDHVYDEDQKDWIAIIVHPLFAVHQDFWKKYQHVNVAKPARNSLNGNQIGKTAPTPELEDGKEAWFVLKGDHRFGPFEYLELVRLTQEKSLNDWDYVWTKRLPKWVRISSLPEFHSETITHLRESLSQELGGAVNEVFFRRRFARAAFEGSILVHNNQKLYRGRSLEMSAGGLSLVLNEGDLKISDHLHLHVKPSRETPAFNSACEVMARRVLNAGDPSSPVVYGMKFIGLEDHVKTEIDGWATRTINKTNNSEAA